jgi:hypothetical protein
MSALATGPVSFLFSSFSSKYVYLVLGILIYLLASFGRAYFDIRFTLGCKAHRNGNLAEATRLVIVASTRRAAPLTLNVSVFNVVPAHPRRDRSSQAAPLDFEH